MFHPSRAAVAVALLALTSLAGPARGTTPVPTPNVNVSFPYMSRARFAAVIKGRVTEKETGQPVQAASVTALVGTSRIGALTDADGNYTLRGAPAGSVRLTVSRQLDPRLRARMPDRPTRTVDGRTESLSLQE